MKEDVLYIQDRREINSEKLSSFLLSRIEYRTLLYHAASNPILSCCHVYFIVSFFCLFYVRVFCPASSFHFSVLYHFPLCPHVCKCSDIFMLCFMCMYSPYTPSRLMEYSKISPTHPVFRKRFFVYIYIMRP